MVWFFRIYSIFTFDVGSIRDLSYVTVTFRGVTITIPFCFC